MVTYSHPAALSINETSFTFYPEFVVMQKLFFVLLMGLLAPLSAVVAQPVPQAGKPKEVRTEETRPDRPGESSEPVASNHKVKRPSQPGSAPETRPAGPHKPSPAPTAKGRKATPHKPSPGADPNRRTTGPHEPIGDRPVGKSWKPGVERAKRAGQKVWDLFKQLKP
jgi:hypothetical protein